MATRIPNIAGEVRAITEGAGITGAVDVITAIATAIMTTAITIRIGTTMIETTIMIISAITKAITTTIEPLCHRNAAFHRPGQWSKYPAATWRKTLRANPLPTFTAASPRLTPI
jgi:hypothetical protein